MVAMSLGLMVASTLVFTPEPPSVPELLLLTGTLSITYSGSELLIVPKPRTRTLAPAPRCSGSPPRPRAALTGPGRGW